MMEKTGMERKEMEAQQADSGKQAGREERTACIACGHALFPEPLLILSGMPESAQNIPAAAELSGEQGIELRLCQCPRCGLVQFSCPPVDYYRKVIRAVGLSETMRELRRQDYRHLIEDYGLSGKKFIECGCGRGEFLQVLQAFPAEIYATEADPEYAAAAQALLGDEAHVMNLFPETAETDIPGAPFDCFLSFNFLEHQPDPAAMLGCMYRNLRPGGYGLITVPSFEYILQEGRYYELIRDHIANYTEDSLKKLCQDCGFEVLEQDRIGIGDTLRAVVRKPAPLSLEAQIHNACQDIFLAFQEKQGEKEQAEPLDVSPLRENYTLLREKIRQFTERLSRSGLRLALFGAGHQGFTVAATTDLGSYASYMMDSADFKQGRFAPASHLRIVAPEHFFEEPVEVVMITAPGYVREITALLRERFAAYPSLRICTIDPETYEEVF